MSAPSDREVISCQVCGLVQYRTRTGNCRRCVRQLPGIAAGDASQSSGTGRSRRVRQKGDEKWLNLDLVENVGLRIQQFRKVRGLTQKELYKISRVSRSYLARIESGQMTPSLGTLEKISEALEISLNSFFIPVSKSEALLEDPFIQELHPFLRQLDGEQCQSILKSLAAVNERAAFGHANSRPFGMRQSARMDKITRRPIRPATLGHRSVG